MSESFVNHAATSSGTFDATGAPATGLAASAVALTFAYNAGSQSYTVTTQGRSQTFAPGDRDATQSNAQITTYKKVNGSTTDLLTITNPGTSGSLLYKYVAGGFWQRTVQSGNTLTGSFDAFTYGVATPSASVPTSGGAAYDLDLLGVLGVTGTPAPFSLRGTGTMTLDFAGGIYTASGTNIEIDILSGATVQNDTFLSNGTLASGNSLTGSFQLNRGGNGGAVFAGGLNGRLYGPAADEVGGAFWGTGQTLAGSLSGLLIGRRSTGGSGTNLTLLSLVANQNFITKSARVTTSITPATGKLAGYSQQDTSQFTGSGSTGPTFSYNATSNSYTITDTQPAPGQMGPAQVTYGAAQLLASQSDARFTEYRTTSGADGTSLRLYKPGSGNPELVLTYSTFGIWDQTQTPGSNSLNRLDRLYFTYGIASTAFPRTGTAGYTGLINGHGGSTASGSDPMSVAGNFGFTFDFAADNFSGTFSPVGTNLLSGATTNFGTYNVVTARGPLATGGGFDAFLTLPGISNPTGALKGAFFGPVINDIAGTWVIRETDTVNAGQFIGLTGAFVGKKN